MAAATPNITPCAAELKGEAGSLEQGLSFASDPGENHPRKSPLPSALPCTPYWPELGHTPTHRPWASPTFSTIQGSLPKVLSEFLGGGLWLDHRKCVLNALLWVSEALSSGPGPVSVLLSMNNTTNRMHHPPVLPRPPWTAWEGSEDGELAVRAPA